MTPAKLQSIEHRAIARIDRRPSWISALLAVGLGSLFALSVLPERGWADEAADEFDDVVMAAFTAMYQSQNTATPDATQPGANSQQLQQPRPRARPQTPAQGNQGAQGNGQQRSQFDVGSTANALGGARGPQASAPYMIGDLMGVGMGSIVIPAASAPGTPFNATLPTLSPATVALPNNQNSPVTFTSPQQQPFFTPQTFTSAGSLNSANAAFSKGQPIALIPSQQFNHDAQAFLIATHPSGTVLPTGQTATGGGTALLQNSQATSTQSPLPSGRNINGMDQFNLQNTYLYTPNVAVGPGHGETLSFPTPGNSGSVLLGIVKIAENTSPLPRDRVFFNYSLFTGTQLAPGGASVNRFTPGFEKTFFNTLMSFEMRFPFAASINPDLLLNNNTVATAGDVIFGNVSAILKGLLYQDEQFAFSGGLQVALPTASALSLSMPDGTKIVNVANQAVHLMPFMGALYTPNDRFFAQGFIQADVDSNGNQVSVNPTMQQLTPIGRIFAPTMLYIDTNVGYWLYRGERRSLTGFAPTLEFHHNQSTSHSQFLASNGFMIGGNLNQVSFDSITVGCYLEYERNTTLALGYTTPLGNGADRQFQGELRAFLTHRFGTPSRAARIGF